jgi:hypothetical protein
MHAKQQQQQPRSLACKWIFPSMWLSLEETTLLQKSQEEEDNDDTTITTTTTKNQNQI